MGIATYQANRFSRTVDRSGRHPIVNLATDASDLELGAMPDSFMLMGADNQLHTFTQIETLRDGTVDNEVLGWRYAMSGRVDIFITIYND